MLAKNMKEIKPNNITKYIINIILLLFILIIGCKSYFTVDAGEVGVTFNMITGNTKAFSQGTYFKIPFVVSVVDFDVKTQKEDIRADSASKDLQKVIIHIVINYHLDYTKVNELYVKVGRDYSQKVINPAVNEAVKAATAQFPVEQIIVERERLKTTAEKLLNERLKEYNIILESVNLVDITFDSEFNKVVEQKQIEEQKIKTSEYKRRQAEELKRKTILEAEAEARKQQLLRASVNRDIVSLKWIEKWDGKLPTYMLGDKSVMMMKGD